MSKNYFDLTGQVAIVTGCSTGLGVQMAKALANQGAKIVAIARRKEMIEAVAKEIADTYKVETLAIPCDITDTEKVNAAVDEVMKKFGRIDIVINNAGTGAVAPAEDITDDQFNGELNVDLGGTFKVARAVAKSNDSCKIWPHHQYCFYVRSCWKQSCSLFTLPRRKRWCCKPYSRSCL